MLCIVIRPQTEISIHTLRVEGDSDTPLDTELLIISIHTLRVEGDSKNIQAKFPK